MSRYIKVMLYTNDPDNGMDTRRCSAVYLQGDERIQLECQYADWGPTCYVRGGKLRFSRRRLPCVGEVDWAGRCWHSVSMTPAVALEFVQYLRDLGWRVDKAESHFFRLFNEVKPIRASDLMTALFVRAAGASTKGDGRDEE